MSDKAQRSDEAMQGPRGVMCRRTKPMTMGKMLLSKGSNRGQA